MGRLPQKNPISLQFITHVTEEMVPPLEFYYHSMVYQTCSTKVIYDIYTYRFSEVNANRQTY